MNFLHPTDRSVGVDFGSAEESFTVATAGFNEPLHELTRCQPAPFPRSSA